MKRITTLIIALLLAASARGQILRYGNWTPTAPPAALYGLDEGWDGQTDAWFARDTALQLSGGYVTQWDDISGNGHHILPIAADGSEGTADNRPAGHVVNGVTFDGSNDALRCMIAGWSTVGQRTIYAVVKMESWASNDVLFGYAGTGSIRVTQKTTTPNIYGLSASGDGSAITGFTIGTVGILILDVDGSASTISLSLNNGTATTNTGSLSGFTAGGILLGASHAAYPALQRWGNVTIYEIIYRKQIDSGATRTAFYNYLDAKY